MPNLEAREHLKLNARTFRLRVPIGLICFRMIRGDQWERYIKSHSEMHRGGRCTSEDGITYLHP